MPAAAGAQLAAHRRAVARGRRGRPRLWQGPAGAWLQWGDANITSALGLSQCTGPTSRAGQPAAPGRGQERRVRRRLPGPRPVA